MASAAKPLLDEIKSRFYPFVRDRGFVRQKATNPQHVEFRRQTAARTDVFEIQWDKYWRPRFVLNIGRSTEAEGSRGLPGRLQRRRCGDLCCWFGLHRPWLSRLRSGRWSFTPTEVVDELIRAFDELEAWWAGGEPGPHIYIYQLHA